MSIYAHSNPYMEGKCMGFCSTEVWVMGYGRIMGFGSKIPANRVGGRDFLWVMAGYGLPRVWVKTGSTVHVIVYEHIHTSTNRNIVLTVTSLNCNVFKAS